MADKRINALTTTSASVGDDYFAIDGATNGTRALSAFSPTFGGNATVTGTLTTNGYTFTSGTLSSFSSTAGIYNYYSSGVGVLASYSDGSGTRSQTQISGSIVSLNTAAGNALTVSAAGVVAIPATTASTTTSTGALVVGNGTSGGLGVGGAASIGGPILVGTSSDVYLSRTGAGVLDLRSASTPGTLGRLDINGTTSAAVGFRQTGSRDWFITAESFELRVSCLTAASIFAFNSGTPVAMRDTTASTSTSSGALVVSGGVGVAGAVNVGGIITTAGEYLQGSNVNFNIISTATSGNVYLKSNGGILYLNNTVGNGDIRLGNTGTVAYVVGTAASTTTLTGAILVSGGVGVSGAVNAGTFYGLVDGVTAPATESGYARIYVDSADGDLKVKFGDGTVKTIATDS